MSAEDRERLVEEAREKMLKGEDTPWLEHETHRGEEPHLKNEGQAPSMGPDAEHRGQENTGGAFGKQKGTPDERRHGDNTRDKAIEKRQGLKDEG